MKLLPERKQKPFSAFQRYFILSFIVFGVLVSPILAADASSDKNVVDVVVEGYDPLQGGDMGFLFENTLCYQLMREDPRLRVLPYHKILLTSGSVSSQLLAFAGGMAPDVLISIEYHTLGDYVKQGFLLPLNEFIGEDKNGNGQIDDDEAIWPDWKYVPEFYRRIATIDGKIYALPNPQEGIGAILYRKDLFRKAGLDPNVPPRDWDEFFYFCQKITDPRAVVAGAKVQMGRYALLIEPRGWRWGLFLWSAGGNLVLQGKTNPKTGKTWWWPQEELKFVDPETGEDLSRQPTKWKVDFASEAGCKAVRFFQRLRFQKWIRDPRDGEPVNLTDAQAQAGKILRKDGTELVFSPDDVIEGVVRINWGSGRQEPEDLMRRSEVAMILQPISNKSLNWMGFSGDTIGMFAVPPSERGGTPAMLGEYHWRALNAQLAGPQNAEKRQKAWKVLSAMCGRKGVELYVERTVRSGGGRLLDPDMLRRFGLEKYMVWIPENWLEQYDAAKKYTRAEPYVGFWQPIAAKLLGSDVLELAMTVHGFDAVAALKKAQQQANLDFESKQQRVVENRPLAWALGAVWVAAILMMGLLLVRSLQVKTRKSLDAVAGRGSGSARGVVRWFVPVLLLAPALLLVGMWKYYPLAAGSAMSFQDYRIFGDSSWVGMDNFIKVFLDDRFYVSMKQTFKFVAVSLLLGFAAPIFLALLLSEVPRGKTFWRTIFFLPQVSSGLVILFLWKMFYHPTQYGFLNRVLGYFGVSPQDWLGDPTWTMAAVIVPGVWAGAGMGSLIYLAALKSIPEELYEAAEVDGAGMLAKLRYVTLPALKPLVIINFIGAFIGTFHTMSNIFALTGGGPGNETMVMSLNIWYEAFAFLRFGTATALAWVLGSILLGFTILQLRWLSKVDFRRAEAA